GGHKERANWGGREIRPEPLEMVSSGAPPLTAVDAEIKTRPGRDRHRHHQRRSLVGTWNNIRSIRGASGNQCNTGDASKEGFSHLTSPNRAPSGFSVDLVLEPGAKLAMISIWLSIFRSRLIVPDRHRFFTTTAPRGLFH